MEPEKTGPLKRLFGVRRGNSVAESNFDARDGKTQVPDISPRARRRATVSEALPAGGRFDTVPSSFAARVAAASSSAATSGGGSKKDEHVTHYHHHKSTSSSSSSTKMEPSNGVKWDLGTPKRSSTTRSRYGSNRTSEDSRRLQALRDGVAEKARRAAEERSLTDRSSKRSSQDGFTLAARNPASMASPRRSNRDPHPDEGAEVLPSDRVPRSVPASPAERLTGSSSRSGSGRDREHHRRARAERRASASATAPPPDSPAAERSRRATAASAPDQTRPAVVLPGVLRASTDDRADAKRRREREDERERQQRPLEKEKNKVRFKDESKGIRAVFKKLFA